MHRKLSEIAEIPKILSSTLATVSQTFDKLMPSDAMELKRLARRGVTHRKFSYDEDLVDYEISDNPSDDDGDEDDIVAGEDSEVSEQESGVKRAEGRDLTPESDYASEVDYFGNEGDEDPEGDGDNDDDDSGDDDYDSELHGNDSIEGDEYLQMIQGRFCEEEEEEEDDDGDDFLSTSYTWNMRNVPKLILTDESNSELEVGEKLEDEQRDAPSMKVEGKTELEIAQESPNSAVRHVKQEKLDKLERSWPWADRQKIIYKQSTCHLVPRKPLGIIGQRIQLLAKQNLVDNLKQSEQHQRQQLEKK